MLAVKRTTQFSERLAPTLAASPVFQAAQKSSTTFLFAVSVGVSRTPGGLHIAAHTLDAIAELFPMFRRMKMLRNWGGIVDVTPDRSPIIGKTPVKGLYVANMFQVYPHDRGQNYSIALAERLVEHLES